MTTIHEFLSQIHTFREANITRDWTVDKLYIGDENRELTKLAVTMFPTLDVMKQAAAWGAQLLLGHESALGSRDEQGDADEVWHAKKIFLEQNGLAYARFHDHPHFMPLDLIDEGTIRYSGLQGEITGKPYWAITSFHLKAPMTARQVALTLQQGLNTPHIRVAGQMDIPGENIAFACGTPGHIMECLKRDDIDFIVTGEICEYAEGEYVRELAALGRKKAILVLGHCISERYGMRLLAELLQAEFPLLESRYFECGDLYSYPEQ